MKARVDSKEFSQAVRTASRWTSSTGMESTKAIILEARDPWLILRTTTGDQDCILAVNAFDVEPGRIVTRASTLVDFAWDSGGWLRLRDTKTKLVLAYEDFAESRVGLLEEKVIDLFPELVETEEIAELDSITLMAAANHTAPLKQTGLPIKSAVHIVPIDDTTVCVGTDGIIGYRKIVLAKSEAMVSIDGALLAAAVAAVGPTISIGTSGNRVQVSSTRSPSLIQFSTVSCPDPSKIVKQAFSYETTAGVVAKQASMKRLGFLCGKAASADAHAELMISSTGGKVMAKIKGWEVEIEEAVLADGELPTSFFRCDGMYRSISQLSDAAEYQVSAYLEGSATKLFYIDGTARHFMMAIEPAVFEQNGKV